MRTTGRRLRRGAATLAALALVALGAPAATAADGTSGAVPTRVHDPWLWQATVEQRPAGPAALVFFTSQTRYLESTGVLVDRDGGYRLIPLQIGEGHGLLSPDGRHYLRPFSGELLDLTTGRRRPTLSPGIQPLAWSPDGRQVIGTRSNNDSVITYGPDNQQLNDPEKPDDLLVVDPYRGTEQVVAAGTYAAHDAAAWSPGGDLLAVAGPPDVDALVAQHQRLMVVDPAGGGPRWQVDLGERRMLAGPAAWHPDGRRIALLAFDRCASPTCTVRQAAARSWRIEFLDAATGRAVDKPLPVDDASTTRIVGWRGADPVVQRVTDAERVEGRRASLVAVSADGGREVLLTAPDGATDIAVPGDLLARAAFGGPERRPSPFVAPLWFYLALAVLSLLTVALCAVALLAVRRRRRRRCAVEDPA